MKKHIKQLFSYIDKMHSYPYWVFLFFLYASILTFGGCALLGWYPKLLTNVKTAPLTAELLFECAMGLLLIGCITSTIMDLVLHIDLDKN